MARHVPAAALCGYGEARPSAQVRGPGRRKRRFPGLFDWLRRYTESVYRLFSAQMGDRADKNQEKFAKFKNFHYSQSTFVVFHENL